MARQLTQNQRFALDYIEAEGDATIQEVADATGMAYPTASQALARLHLLGAIHKDKLGNGTNKLVYSKVVLENPDSKDPLEQAFALPSAQR